MTSILRPILLTPDEIREGARIIESVPELQESLRSAFWIRIHKQDPSKNFWQLVLAFHKGSPWYDHPVLGSPSYGIVIESTSDRNNLLVTQALEVPTFLSPDKVSYVYNFAVSKHVTFDAVVYMANHEVVEFE